MLLHVDEILEDASMVRSRSLSAFLSLLTVAFCAASGSSSPTSANPNMSQRICTCSSIRLYPFFVLTPFRLPVMLT